MKYISMQTLIDYGKNLRFQSADQMAKVYEQIPGIELGRCEDCDNWHDGNIDSDCYWDNEYHTDNPGPDDFCSRWVERKEEQ